MPDDELTPRDDWNGEKIEEPDELEEFDVAEPELLEPWLDVEVPGIVEALTTASTPTLAIAPIATQVVRLFSVSIASSRAMTLALLALVSMVCILGGGSELWLRTS